MATPDRQLDIDPLDYDATVTVYKTVAGGWQIHYYAQESGEEEWIAASSLARAKSYVREHYGVVRWIEVKNRGRWWDGVVLSSRIRSVHWNEDTEEWEEGDG